MNSNTQLWGDMVEDNFPTISDGFTLVKNKKKIAPIIPSLDMEDDDTKPPKKELKKIVCKSIMEGIPCPYENKCHFIHYLDEACPTECKFGYDCSKIKYTNNKIRNNLKNLCFMLHPDEKIDDYVKRIGVKGSMIRPKPEEIYKNTKMCNSALEGVKCDGKDCTYAHKLEDLRISKCKFGGKCYHVKKEGLSFENQSDKVCIFMHDDETLENYKHRVIDTEKTKLKKRKSEDTLQNSEIKKQKVEKCNDKEQVVVEVKEETSVVDLTKINEDVPDIDFSTVTEYQQDVIYMSVPSNMAQEILDIMIKNGKTKIQMTMY